MIRKAFQVDDAAVEFFNTWNNTMRRDGETIVIACNDMVFANELPETVKTWLLDHGYSTMDVEVDH